MTSQRMAGSLLIQMLVIAIPSSAQEVTSPTPMAEQYVDPRGGLSLQDAIRIALELEPGLKAVRTDIEAAQGRRLQGTLRPNPSVSVEYRGEPSGSDNQAMAQVQWPLDLFRRGPREESAIRDVEVSQRAADNRARLLAGEVRARYGDAAAAIRGLTLTERAVDLMSQQFVQIRQRAEEGAVPPLERDQFEVELHRFEAERLLVVGRVEAALVELRRAIGATPETTTRLRDTLDTLAASAVQDPIAGSPSSDPLAGRSDLLVADAQLRLAEAKVSQAASEGRFDVSLYGGYTRMDTGFSQLGFNEFGRLERVRGVFHYLSAGAMVTMPLRNANQGEVAAARAGQAGARFRLEEARLVARAEIAAAEARESAARRALVITKATVDLASRNLSVVREAYELGRTTVSDVLAEQRRYLDVERGHTETLKAAYEAHAALMLARGER